MSDDTEDGTVSSGLDICNVPSEDDTAAVRNAFCKTLSEFVENWCHYQQRSTVKYLECVWEDFVNEFPLEALSLLSKGDQRKMRDTLISKAIFVKHGRNIRIMDALKECWESFGCPVIEDLANLKHGIQPLSPSQIDKMGEAKSVKSNERDVVEGPPPKTEDNKIQNNVGQENKRGRLTDVMKSLSSTDKFRGGFDEDLAGIFETYKSNCDLLDICDSDILKGIPMLLEGTTLTFFHEEVKPNIETDKDAFDLMIRSYTSDDQKNRLLDEWRSVDLVEWF